MKKVIVPFAEGFEEIEAITIVDTLRRAGLEVSCASISEELLVTGANGIKITCDTLFQPTQLADAIILPGGLPGAENLACDKALLSSLKAHSQNHKLIGAICAAPWALHNAGLLDDIKVTCYPGFEEKLPNAHWQDKRVIFDQGIITGKGPGTSLEFALKIVEILISKEQAKVLAQGMIA